MGRLKIPRAMRMWAPPVLIVVAMLVGVNAAFASSAPPPTELERYLKTVDLIPYTKVVDGYDQVYYLYKGEDVLITNDQVDHSNPHASGRYISWIQGSGSSNELCLHDVLTGTTIKLTTLSINGNQHMDGHKVVWEQWVNDGWQVMYYDGFSVRQVSRGSSSVRPRIHDNKIAYVQYIANDVDKKPWHIIEYNADSDEANVVATTDKDLDTWPHYINNGRTLKLDYDLEYLRY